VLEPVEDDDEDLTLDRRPGPVVPVIKIPDRIVYHAAKHSAFVRLQGLLELAEAQYRREKTARSAEAVTGIIREMHSLIESLEDGIDPAKATLALDQVLHTHMENLITGLSTELKRLFHDTVKLDPKNKATHWRNTLEAFRRLGKRVTFDHQEMRRALGGLMGADPAKKKAAKPGGR